MTDAKLRPLVQDHLRFLVSPAEHSTFTFELDELDSCLVGRGLRTGALHEVMGHSCTLADEASAVLFVAGIAARAAKGCDRPVLWTSCRNDLYAPGLAQVGLSPARLIQAQPPDDVALLAVVEDALCDGTPATIVAEVREVSMVASRRIQLAAADADILVLLLRQRRSRDQDPFAEPSAAWTRWRIGSAPSERLIVAGVGRSRWLVELVRQRGGEPFSMILEGCDETGRLAVPAASADRAAEAAGTIRHKAA